MPSEIVQESTIPLRDRWHSGEKWVQDQMNVRDQVEQSSAIFRPYLTQQMQEFVPGLEYMFLGTLDSDGRPWVSILAGPKGFMRSPRSKTLEINIAKHELRGLEGVHDPIYNNLVSGESFSQGDKTMWSGVALDFSNRRRNKMNGVLNKKDLLVADPTTGELHINLTVEQTIGNCPKYITIRELYYPTEESNHEGSSIFDLDEDQGLTELQQSVVRQADCVFISSRHIDESLPDQTSGMDCNHRGGNPGFVHLEGRTITFPDYSGNRFFNTLGNIAEDERVGLLFLSFETGDTLQFTGRAKLLFGEESQAMYPHSQRVVQVTLDSVVFRRAALPFRMRTKELSPYNPRVPGHRLASGGTVDGERTMATLTGITKHSDDVSTFYFTTSHPINYQPGQYAVLDFSQFNTTGYRHMAPDNPQSLNDDYIRTWTISSAPLPAPESEDEMKWQSSQEFTLTIKRKPGGLLSTALHRLDPTFLGRLTVPLVSTDGEFVLPQSLYGTGTSSPLKIAMISGGIGSTPFISMLRGLRRLQSQSWSSVSIHWIISATHAIEALPQILKEICGSPDDDIPGDGRLELNVSIFLSREAPEESMAGEVLNLKGCNVFFKRLDSQSLAEVLPDLRERKVMVCGPDMFMDAVRSMADKLGVPANSVQSEAFNF
ncbi:hypothetical protein BGZ83_003835 [Gryganskiella cystojenkinii]|nr:hypothetical protein BGZ83_003835 [Gryganskiella cystojenkinii]